MWATSTPASKVSTCKSHTYATLYPPSRPALMSLPAAPVKKNELFCLLYLCNLADVFLYLRINCTQKLFKFDATQNSSPYENSDLSCTAFFCMHIPNAEIVLWKGKTKVWTKLTHKALLAPHKKKSELGANHHIFKKRYNAVHTNIFFFFCGMQLCDFASFL